MADEKRHSLIFSPRFLLLCLYIMCYVALRGYDEIIYQAVDLSAGREVVKEHIVGSSPLVPRWRRQAYRIVFSPLMVVEEEARRLADKGQGLVQNASEYGRSYLPD